MGPSSVINTWSPTASFLRSDNDVESMVLTPELVVYPRVEEDLLKNGDQVDDNIERQRQGRLRYDGAFGLCWSGGRW